MPDVWIVYDDQCHLGTLRCRLFRQWLGWGQREDEYLKLAYRIDNVRTMDEVVKRFDHDKALQCMLMAVFS
jgi:hypothetical protein